MRFTKISGTSTSTVSTVLHKAGNKSYHNVKHGSYGKGLWKWSIGMKSDIFPVVDNKTLTLDQDNYILIPVKRNNATSKDGIGNTMYNISTDEMLSHKNDIIALWEPDAVNINDFEYTITGCIEEIGKGYTGKTRNDRTIKIPTPIFEITGSCDIKWEGIGPNNVKHSQHISYCGDTDEWNIRLPQKQK